MSEETKAVQPTVVRKSRFVVVVKRLFIAIVVVVAVFAGVVAVQPNEFQIVRSATIDAPPDKVFPHVNDFHKWEAWSPWAKLDPAARNSFDGPSSGKGAIFSWDGNDKVGAGRMTITDSRSSDLIQIKLEFFRPFEDTSTTEFTFKPDGAKTLVTWNMSGRKNFISKAVCMFMNMDKMVGGQFEEGLANMKAAVAAEAAERGDPADAKGS